MNLTRLWQYIQRIIYVYFTSLPGKYQEKKLLHLRFLYETVNDFLKNQEIHYWLDFGTLLGYYRSKDILAHDIDVDFGIHENFYKKVWNAKNQLPPQFTMYDTSFKHRGPKLYISHKGFDVDLYFYEDSGNKLASYEISKYPCEMKPIEKDVVLPIREVNFLGKPTFVPHQPRAYLEHYYGYIGKNGIRDEKTGYWTCKKQ